jgi:hypothetical protein
MGPRFHEIGLCLFGRIPTAQFVQFALFPQICMGRFAKGTGSTTRLINFIIYFVHVHLIFN